MDVELRASHAGAVAAEAASGGPEQYFSAVQDLLGVIVGADLIMWNDIDLAAARVSLEGREREEWAWLLPSVEATAPENPMVRAFLRARRREPHRMSDHLSSRALVRTRLYTDLFRPMGARFQVGLPTRFHGHPYIRGWAMNRKLRDFDEEDMKTLRLVQPALNQLEDIVCGTTLPLPRESQGLSAPGQLGPDERLRMERLTPREREILGLLAKGWTASHIAHFLRISAKTVNKHLQNIYDKLGTRDRLMVVRRFVSSGT